MNRIFLRWQNYRQVSKRHFGAGAVTPEPQHEGSLPGVLRRAHQLQAIKFVLTLLALGPDPALGISFSTAWAGLKHFFFWQHFATNSKS